MHNLTNKGYDEDGKNKVAIQRVGGAVIPAVNVYPITSELKGESKSAISPLRKCYVSA